MNAELKTDRKPRSLSVKLNTTIMMPSKQQYSHSQSARAVIWKAKRGVHKMF